MRTSIAAVLLSVAFLFLGCSEPSLLQLEDQAADAAHQVRSDSDVSRQLAQVRRATAAFNVVSEAEESGYHLHDECVTGPPDLGSMGYHADKGALVGDGEVDAMEPEALVYEPHGPNEELELVAVEYLALASEFSSAPSLFGETFVDHTEEGTTHGLPPHYELHAWIWTHNPAGTFAQWNPKVSCPEE